ncbi:MAG: Gfo/Idh/MocA family oxidoreductase [Saprospiraceae bacterium]|nr:Gfo/Idh/MocA family oxidoreductase [Saprospiraceae bacterium]
MERRAFLKASSMLTASAWMAPIPAIQADSRIKLGIVGTGWWGTDYLLKFASMSGEFDIVALCDVNQLALQNAADKLVAAGAPKPALFHNHEELYEFPELQAVVIATPTHWHALQFIGACKKGLHVWQEKPISYDIREAQAMKAAYEKSGIVVNIDFPRLHAPINEQVKDYIQSGKVGEIYQVQANIHNPVGAAEEAEIPATMDYERFCGPAPRPKYLAHPVPGRTNWRLQQGFSRGILADWGIHYLQNIRWIMDLDLPDQISAMGGITRKLGQDHPDHLEVRFDYGGLPVMWTHKTWGFTSPLPHTNIGVFYFGDKGTIFAADSGWEVYPADKGERKEYGNVRVDLGSMEYEQEIKREFVTQFQQFAKAIRLKSDSSIKGTFKQGFNSTSAVIYADLAYHTRSAFSIDKNSMDVKGNEEAQSLLMRPYREPYRHPYRT